MSFRLTPKQDQAIAVIGRFFYIMLFGGSRSGKTFIAIRSIVIRALAAQKSRHVILRFRFNHVKASVVRDTFPKVMETCFPDIPYHLDKTDWFVQFPNRSEIWFGGLDDKERTEKILGNEYATIYLNESSQIPYNSYLMVVTRLAQQCYYELDGQQKPLNLRLMADCNPPSQAHWSYKLFIQKHDPDTNKKLANPGDYGYIQMNPRDNLENLPPAYIKHLENMPARMRKRFLDGEFADTTENALWSIEIIERNREDELPDMQRIVVSVDPSGSGDTDNADNDAIGIVVCGLGTDGYGYVLEDLTIKAGPAKWGAIAVSAYVRHDADAIVGETNYGGEMVKYVIQSAWAKYVKDQGGNEGAITFKKVTASRGKVVRAEPIAALSEQNKIRYAGTFTELEDELLSFTTNGYIGERSPNRGDAFIWGMSELFPGILKKAKEKPKQERSRSQPSEMGMFG